MRRFLLVSLLLVFVLTACESADALDAGEVLTPQEQQSLYDARQEQSDMPDTNDKAIVYWTSSGTKYHKDAGCSYIKNAKEIHNGTVAQAINYGASSPCSRCAKG